MAQASEYLGATPVDTWRRNDGSVLARWAYKGTVATDALYFRQEAWLLFGSDGTFERTEKSINTPPANHTRTLAQARRDEAAQAAKSAPIAEHESSAQAAQTLPVQPQAALQTEEHSVTTGNLLLPIGTTYTPGVSYPISQPK